MVCREINVACREIGLKITDWLNYKIVSDAENKKIFVLIYILIAKNGFQC